MLLDLLPCLLLLLSTRINVDGCKTVDVGQSCKDQSGNTEGEGGGGGSEGGSTTVSSKTTEKEHQITTTPSTGCVFPFIFEGKTYYTCINYQRSLAWCSLTSNFDKHKQWKYCIGGDNIGDCSGFAIGLSKLLGGPKETSATWNVQCPPGTFSVGLWDDNDYFENIDDMKCCQGNVDQNVSVSHMTFNLRQGQRTSGQDGHWFQCSENRVITALYRRSNDISGSSQFDRVDGVKCSLVIGSRLVTDDCEIIDVENLSGGQRSPGERWKAQCPKGSAISGILTKDSKSGIRSMKCCPLSALSTVFKRCTFESGYCDWLSMRPLDSNWQVTSSDTMNSSSVSLPDEDHTLRSKQGYFLHLNNSGDWKNSDDLATIGIESSLENRCFSFWLYSRNITGQMRVVVIFYNKTTNKLEQRVYYITQESQQWTEHQTLLPRGVHQQVIVQARLDNGEGLSLDDLTIRHESMCSGLCTTRLLEPSFRRLRRRGIRWLDREDRVSCAGASGLSGLFYQSSSGAVQLTSYKCCNAPVANSAEYTYNITNDYSLASLTQTNQWKLQCAQDYIITEIQLKTRSSRVQIISCSKLLYARVNMSRCLELQPNRTREDYGIKDGQYSAQCPMGYYVVGVYDNRSTNVVIDSVKCCQVQVSECRPGHQDCNPHGAKCLNDTGLFRCVCDVGFSGDGFTCVKNVQCPTKKTSAGPNGDGGEGEHTNQPRTVHAPTSSSPTSTAHQTNILDYRSGGEGSSTYSWVYLLMSIVLVAMVFVLAIIYRRGRYRQRKHLHHCSHVAHEIELQSLETLHGTPEQCHENISFQGDELSVDSRSFISLRCLELMGTLEEDQDIIVENALRVRSLSTRSVSKEHIYVSPDLTEAKEETKTSTEPFYHVLEKTCVPVNKSLAHDCGPCESDDPEYYNHTKFSEPCNNEEELVRQLSNEMEIPRYELQVEDRRIGAGAFGDVKAGTWVKDNETKIPVAVKTMKKPDMPDAKVRFLQEAAIMNQFSHRNVVRMFGVVTVQEPIMIVLEYMSSGNLRHFLRKLKQRKFEPLRPLLQEDHRLFVLMARDIAAGMRYLALKLYAHRDLAARNVLLDSSLTCKIGDFGLSRDLLNSSYYSSRGGKIPVKWTAPEALNFGRYSSPSDVWSYGIVLYEIWSLGMKPYAGWGNAKVIEEVSRGYRLPPPDFCPRTVYRLMIDCWHPDSKKRPSFSQIAFLLSSSEEKILGDMEDVYRCRSSSVCVSESRHADLQYIYSQTG